MKLSRREGGTDFWEEIETYSFSENTFELTHEIGVIRRLDFFRLCALALDTGKKGYGDSDIHIRPDSGLLSHGLMRRGKS